MRLRTVLVLVVVLAGAAAIVASQQSASAEGELRELWVSGPAEELQSNHHSPAATYFQGEAYVAVPINSRQATVCKLLMLDGDGNTRWEDGISGEGCNVHSFSDPTIADYDEDGVPEVLVATSEQAFVAYNLTTGEEELRRNLSSYGYSRPLVANLTADEGNETTVIDLLGGVFVYGPDGNERWSNRFEDARVREPTVADVDGDGAPEVVFGLLLGEGIALENDGSVAWRTTLPNAVSTKWMAVGQGDDDPQLEVAYGTFNGSIVLLDGANGTVEWQTEITTQGAAVHSIGDGDRDGTAEVYVAARNGNVSSLNATTGEMEWTTPVAGRNVTEMAPPALGDVDGDGNPELVAVSHTGRVAVLDPGNGTVQASYSRDVPVETFPRLVDITGDGVNEIIVIYDDGQVAVLSYESG